MIKLLSDSCQFIPGVGPKLFEILQKLGIDSVFDLIMHLPLRYQDRTRVTPIGDLMPNSWGVVVGEVSQVEIKLGRRRQLQCLVHDASGILKLRFFTFNKNQMENLKAKPLIKIFGLTRGNSHNLEMIHPEYQLVDKNEIISVEMALTPIYPLTLGLTQTKIRKLIKTCLDLYQDHLGDLEYLNGMELLENKFVSIKDALNIIHAPPPNISLSEIEDGEHSAIRRLIFDELLAQYLSTTLAKKNRVCQKVKPIPASKHLTQLLKKNLPFNLTTAQEQVNREIEADLQTSKPMLRLIQGDVGSGKTIVAAISALHFIEQKKQVALMAPTEVLSNQHYNNFVAWFEPLGVKVLHLTGKMRAREKKAALLKIASHGCDLIIGTHALFQDNVEFACLQLIIIDEQHRFGVEQRLNLQAKGVKGNAPLHQLHLTATPIPRTLAMTQFAHMDISIINLKPQNRLEVKTSVLSQSKREQIIERLKFAINAGSQVYWVCTLIEESEKLQCQTAIKTSQDLQNLLPKFKVGLIHGKMKGADKDAVMLEFKKGDIQILVATTVIEVGIDVAQANLIIIENAERLGLSQLHQLRGRVGRGSNQSYCLLLYQAPLSHVSKERLQIMKETNDGFVIADKDLELRGFGELLGTRQTGYRQFKIAKLPRDIAILENIKPYAQNILKSDLKHAESLANRWFKNAVNYAQS